MLAQLPSHVQLFVTLWTVNPPGSSVHEYLRQEYWNGLTFPPPGHLPNPGTEPEPLTSPALTGGSWPLHHPHLMEYYYTKIEKWLYMGTCSSYSFKLKYQDKELFYWVFSQCKRGRRASEKTGSFKTFSSIKKQIVPSEFFYCEYGLFSSLWEQLSFWLRTFVSLGLVTWYLGRLSLQALHLWARLLPAGCSWCSQLLHRCPVPSCPASSPFG